MKKVVLYYGPSDERNIQAYQHLERLIDVRVRADTSLVRARGLRQPLPWLELENGRLICGITAIRTYVRTHQPKRRHLSFQAVIA